MHQKNAKLSYPDAVAEEDADRRQQDGQQDLQERLRPHCRRCARRLLVLVAVYFYSSSLSILGAQEEALEEVVAQSQCKILPRFSSAQVPGEERRQCQQMRKRSSKQMLIPVPGKETKKAASREKTWQR